jgi:hypothetical protein
MLLRLLTNCQRASYLRQKRCLAVDLGMEPCMEDIIEKAREFRMNYAIPITRSLHCRTQKRALEQLSRNSHGDRFDGGWCINIRYD